MLPNHGSNVSFKRLAGETTIIAQSWRRTQKQLTLTPQYPISTFPHPAINQYSSLVNVFCILDPERAWSTERAMAIHTASCKRVLNTLAYRLTQDLRTPELHGHVVREFSATIDEPSPPQPDSIGSKPATHVLFFDGGSRGNPGPGGSGACVTRVDLLTGAATIIWSAAVSHAHPATTNNQAEYQGLITDLRAAHQNKWLPLEVVGDSALILSSYAPTLNRRITVYFGCTRLHDVWQISSTSDDGYITHEHPTKWLTRWPITPWS